MGIEQGIEQGINTALQRLIASGMNEAQARKVLGI
jgi:hypothetical protein